MTSPTSRAPILYVEDEENDVLLLKLAFKRASLDTPIQTVSDGGRAMAYLRGEGDFSDRAKHPLPGLVLLDLNLPQQDGFTILERIRTEESFPPIPVVVFSSSDHPADRARAEQLGAAAYSVKPSRIDQLIDFATTLHAQWLVTD